MKQSYLTYLISMIFIAILGGLGSWIFLPAFFKTTFSLVSPLPSFLTIISNKQVSSLNMWIPRATAEDGMTALTDVSARGVILYDLATEKVLFAKNEKEKMPMASITKVMSAIIALENPKSDNKYMVSVGALVGENSMGLTANEILTREDLLYGLMLPSGNDAAETLAYNHPNGREAFIQAMNDKARALGAVDTNFTNPSGLEGDGDQHTTAYDLLIITKYAMENFPVFRKVVSTYEHVIPYSPTHKAYTLYNDTNLITTYPGVRGVKTGYTPEAGLCLITYLDYGGHQIIGILLGSNNRRAEMKNLLDYGLQIQGITPPKHQ